MKKKKSKKIAKISEKEFKASVLTYFNKQRRFKKIKDDMEIIKKSFYEAMEDYFQCNELEDSVTIKYDCYANEGGLVVKRVQPKTIEFDANKLEKRIGKELAKDVIVKSYTIDDMNGLIAYLKECGVDPNIFKSFVNVEKKVNQKQLDNLYELGKIDENDIEGCFTVNARSPYFTVNLAKEKGK